MTTVIKGRTMTRSITSTRPLDMTLKLDCTEDPLSESQLMLKSKLHEDYQRVTLALDELIKKDGGSQVLAQSNAVSGYQLSVSNCGASIISSKPSQLSINQNITKPPQSIKLNVLNNSSSSQQQAGGGNIQLVMDPRMGLILNTVPQNQNSAPNSLNSFNCPKPTIIKTSQSGNENNQLTRSTRQNTIRAKVLQIQQPEIIEDIPQSPEVSTSLASPPKSSITALGAIQSAQTHSLTNLKAKSTRQSAQHPSTTVMTTRPTEQTSIGGIAVGNKHTADMIDESKKNLPDGKEIAFNKINGGRTFPSLVVIARPYIRAKDVPAQIATKERNELDAKVKSVLMFSATRFAEWLIQQGLVKSEQYCDQHGNNNPKPKLKLGMYSDSGTFPYSGGYVWISSCCPDRFVSVFSGSIFQGAPHTPSVLLKLIYHWSCQTNVQNVVSWVKVSNVYVKNFYTNLRSICTAAVWDKSQLIGGKGWNIQVGVISLGTTSQDGNLRQVKVEVLGILNPETGELRLRACEPVQDNDRTFKRRFNNILLPLKDWVHKDSRIITDFTVDKYTLNNFGFNQVVQVAYSNQNSRNNSSNYQIMDYLRKIVPRMFQNTLSLLSRQMIQQFLDELVWREMFGTTASRAFYSIINHIAEQTRASTSDNLLDRLVKIAANPFNDWSYSHNLNNSADSMAIAASKDISLQSKDSAKSSDTSLLTLKSSSIISTTRKSRKRSMVVTSSGTTTSESGKRMRSDVKFESKDYDKNDEIALHEFYYGTVETDKSIGVMREERRVINFTCFLCTTVVKSNTEVMEHMVKHVPPRVPGQSNCHVCRYCCAAFSSKHQMVTHVAEAHSTFGNSDGHMVVCGICEQKFSNSLLLVSHMATTHFPSEMPYRCESCGYRTSSHKDAIDHFYKFHEKGEYLQCPYCLKIMHYCIDGIAIAANIHAYLIHMQRHVVRREQGRGNKCSRCCLWFNQKSALKLHQAELHIPWYGIKNTSQVSPPPPPDKCIIISKARHQLKKIEVDNPQPELPDDGKFQKWNNPIVINVPASCNLAHNFRCQECEEDIDEVEHYPGEQRCSQCRYVTCCWRAFKEHQQQIHNERPMTSLIVPSPLLNIPLEKKMRCSCGYSTKDGNLLAKHYVECKKILGSSENSGSTAGMLDSLGLVPKNSA